MDVIEAIKTRRSIRGYKPDPVPQEILAQLLEIAARAPSSRNIQPWKVTVIVGEPLEKMKQGSIEQLFSGMPTHVEVLSEANECYEVTFRQRQVGVAKQLFQSMGIKRDDVQQRTEWLSRGFRYFDAPAVIILSGLDVLADPMMAFNVGLFAQTLCLAALKFDLGTCIAQQGVSYPEVIRQYANIPKTERIITAISIGYPDWDFPANNVISDREPIDNFVKWCGY